MTSTENTTKLSYRLYQDGDMDSVLELWEKHSGWGGITHKQFTDWYMNTPYGNCMVVVAEDADYELNGQMIFVPSRVFVEGEEFNAYRIMAPIIKNDFRGPDIKNFDHPAYAMFRFGIEEAKKGGHEIIYFLPSIGWVAAVKTFPKYGLPQASVNIYDCLQIDIVANDGSKMANEHYIQPGNFNQEYDQLWKDAVNTLPFQCAVARHSQWLQWKRSRHLVLEMRHSAKHQLNGYVVIKKDSGLVLDLLAGTIVEMELILKLTVEYLHKNNIEQGDVKLTAIKLMQTPIIDQVMHSIPHHKIDFRFAVVYFSLNEKKSLESKEWLMMPDD